MQFLRSRRRFLTPNQTQLPSPSPLPSAQAPYLLGLVRDTNEDVEGADKYYRQALYLDPDHPEALLHLALLKQRQGNTQAAAVLLNRVRRLPQKPKP